MLCFFGKIGCNLSICTCVYLGGRVDQMFVCASWPSSHQLSKNIISPLLCCWHSSPISLLQISSPLLALLCLIYEFLSFAGLRLWYKIAAQSSTPICHESSIAHSLCFLKSNLAIYGFISL